MTSDLKRNLEQEKKIAEEIEVLTSQMASASSAEKKMYLLSINALKKQLKILNDSIPLLLQDPFLKNASKNPESTIVSYNSPITREKQIVSISNFDKENYAQELKIADSSRKALKKLAQQQKDNPPKSSLIARLANHLFLKISEKLAFNLPDLKKDLREANIRMAFATYISISLLIAISLLFLGTIAVIIFYILGILSLTTWFWVPFALAFISLAFCYILPSSLKNSAMKGISDELPFVTIYMSAISSSNVESAQIFKIISENKEYPYVAREMRKIINQIEIYGFDLVTALQNTAKKTTNSKLAELFNGLATNIVSGGSLKSYLEKKSENFLIDYRLERKRYSDLAETFMDMYISILVAAPLILVLLLIVMSSTNIAIGLPFTTLAMMTLGGVVLINILFMVIVHIKQPIS